jgi:hypothetical protein
MRLGKKKHVLWAGDDRSGRIVRRGRRRVCCAPLQQREQQRCCEGEREAHSALVCVVWGGSVGLYREWRRLHALNHGAVQNLVSNRTNWRGRKSRTCGSPREISAQGWRRHSPFSVGLTGKKKKKEQGGMLANARLGRSDLAGLGRSVLRVWN